MSIEVVGREQELLSLRAFLDPPQGPAALVIEGEAGIGKSTVWLAGVEEARERGFQVLSSRPAEAERGLAHAGLGDLLEPVLEELLPVLPPPRRRALEAALLLSEPEGRLDPRAVAVAVQTVLVQLAGERPLLVAVDDVQWLDPSSAAALAFALRRVEREPLRLLLARRLGEGIESSPLEDAVPAEHLRLGPLRLGAVQAIFRAKLGAPVARPTLVRVHETSGGNPFYALELARALAASGREVGAEEPLPVPGTLRELVAARLARLSEATRQALLLAAASSRPTRTLLRPEALDEAVAADVLAHHGEQVRFRHPLLASGLYWEASPAERRAVHRLLSERVADPVEAARHLALATSEPDEAAAARVEAAATRARARGAPVAAAELMEHAVALTPAGAIGDRVRRVLEAAGFHVDSGADRAGDLVESVLPLTHGATRARALRLIGLHRRERRAPGAQYALLREALEHVEGDAALEAEIRVALVNPLFNTDVERMPDGPEHARRAVEAAERAGEPRLLSAALAAKAHLDFTLSRAVPLDVLERAAELERRLASSRMLARLTYARVLIWVGRPDAAGAILLPLYEQALDASLKWEFSSLSFLVDAETRAGNLASAGLLADEFLAVAEATDRRLAHMVALLSRGLVLAWTGEVEGARRDADRAIARADAFETPSRIADSRWVRGFLELSLGDPAAAHEYLAPAVDVVRNGGAGAPARHVPLFRDAAETLAALGRPEEARGLVAWLEEDSANPWAVAAAAHARGLAAASSGDEQGALAALAEAVTAFERLPLPLELGRALVALGSAHRRARRRGDARAALDRAAAIFERHGAALWAARAREELGSIGGRRREEGLTAAERRVAALVAEGKTNREVAAALFLGERTVATHLSHIYAKLGIRSRTELARTLEPGKVQ